MPDSKTMDLMSDWWRKKTHKEDAEETLKKAEKNLIESINKLGDWLTPDDWMMGETFNVWVQGKLLSITLTIAGKSRTRYSVKWRDSKSVTVAMEELRKNEQS